MGTHCSIVSHQYDNISRDTNSLPVPSSPPRVGPSNPIDNEELGAKMNENMSAAITAAVQPTSMNNADNTDAWRVGVSHCEDSENLVVSQSTTGSQVTAHE